MLHAHMVKDGQHILRTAGGGGGGLGFKRLLVHRIGLSYRVKLLPLRTYIFTVLFVFLLLRPFFLD